jgi:hypothetical protein
MGTAKVIVAGLILAFVLDRILLWLESMGWINYRRRGFIRGGASYHALEMQSVFDPGAKELQQARFQNQEERDDSGDPPVTYEEEG